jgi:hypothetical protein
MEPARMCGTPQGSSTISIGADSPAPATCRVRDTGAAPALRRSVDRNAIAAAEPSRSERRLSIGNIPRA